MSIASRSTAHPAPAGPQPSPPARGAGIATAAATLAFVAVTVAGLTWAKWSPYAHKLAGIWSTRSWPGSSPLDVAGRPGAGPSWHGAWSFALSYGRAVWMALVVALVVAAALEALVPARLLVSLLTRRTRLHGSLAGGLLSLPSLMCTCCTAPVAATMRRRGAPTESVVSYWLGNPVLNPATLAFLALTAPWAWLVTRLVAGVALVVGGSVLVARLAPGPVPSPAAPTPPVAAGAAAAAAAGDESLRPAAVARRFGRALTRLALTLVPEYAVVVLAVGALRGWLLPLGGGPVHWGLLALLLACVAGTLLVVPTAGEIPVLQGLAAAGVAAGPVGALLITLPAVSLPSMVMVSRALSWRTTLVTAGVVAVAGLGSAGLLAALT